MNKVKIVYILVAIIYTFNLAFYPFLFGLSNDVTYFASADDSVEEVQIEPEEENDNDDEGSDNNEEENNNEENEQDESSDESESEDDEEDSNEDVNNTDDKNNKEEDSDDNGEENEENNQDENNNENDEDIEDESSEENENNEEENQEGDNNNDEEPEEQILPTRSASIQALTIEESQTDAEFPTKEECMDTDDRKLTMCHATSSDTNPYTRITVSCNAIYGPGGHLNENGTPQAGHEDDVMPDEETGLCPGEEEDKEYGGIKITKEISPIDDSTWDFEIESKDIDDLEYEINGLGHGESETIEDVPAGDYEIRELNVPDGVHVNVECSDGTVLDPVHWDIEVVEGEITECLVVNEFDVDEATLKITKLVYPENDSEWDFHVTGVDQYETYIYDLQHEDSESLTELIPGEYTITELDVPDDYNVSIECDNLESSSSNTISITLGDSENVECFVNNRQNIEEEVGSIRIVKDVEPVDDTKWDFRIEGPAGFEYINGLGDSEGETIDNLPLGEYILTEINLHDDYTTSVSCDNGESTVSEEIKFDLNADEFVTCTFLNENEKPPEYDNSLTIIKDVVPNDESDWDFGIEGPNDFSQNFYNLYDEDSETLINLEPGEYTITELNASDEYNIAIECTNQDTSNEDFITLNLGEREDLSCTFTNRKIPNETPQGSISGYKFDDYNWNNIFDISESRLNDWEINLYNENWEFVEKQTTTTIINIGEFEFDQLQLGSYYVCEVLKDGWLQTLPYSGSTNSTINNSGNLEEAEYCYSVNINEEISDDESSVFGNFEGGMISGYKFFDENNNSEYDEEQRLNNWTINLLNDDYQIIDTRITGMNDKEGFYEFTGLEKGHYYVCEELKDNWIQTYPYNTNLNGIQLSDSIEISRIDTSQCWDIFIRSSGEDHKDKDFGNYQELESELSIQKFNNVNNGGIISKRGENVLYTIKVTAQNGNPFNVSVVDLPPGGFNYVGGSWTANSNYRGDLKSLGVTTEPTYASPGTWKLGDMKDGEVVTLTYLANISNDVESGKHKDLAWAQSDNEESRLLAYAEPTGYVDEYFVGTAAVVDTPNDSPEASVKIEEEVEEIIIEEEVEGQVLGASTLPATGGNILYMILGFLSIIFGIILINGSAFVKRIMMNFKVVIFVYTLIMLMLFSINEASAATSLSVRVFSPEGSVNNPFKLNFVALDIESRPISAECFKQGPSDANFVKFDTTKNLNAGGNSSSCNVSESLLNTNGSYKFKVIGTANGDVSESEIVTVNYNKGDGPDKPKDLDVDRDGDCKYKIEFKTADDGKTDYVELYRSDELEFDIGSSTLTKTISIGPNQKYDDTYEVGSSDCGKRWYFAVRAFDQYGNPSDFTAEEVYKSEEKIVTVTVDGETQTGTITTQAAATSNIEGGVSTYQPQDDVYVQVGSTGPETEGDVLGDEDSSELETEEEDDRRNLFQRLFGFGDDKDEVEVEDPEEDIGAVLGDGDESEKKNWFLRFMAFLFGIFSRSNSNDTEIVIPEDIELEEMPTENEETVDEASDKDTEIPEDEVIVEDEEENQNENENTEEPQNNENLENDNDEQENEEPIVNEEDIAQTEDQRSRFIWWFLPILAIILIIYLARRTEEE